MRTKYGTSARQVKERLLGLKREPQGSVFDTAVQINRLMTILHASMPVDKGKQLSSDYLARDMDNRFFQRYLLIADTNTIAGWL